MSDDDRDLEARLAQAGHPNPRLLIDRLPDPDGRRLVARWLGATA